MVRIFQRLLTRKRWRLSRMPRNPSLSRSCGGRRAMPRMGARRRAEVAQVAYQALLRGRQSAAWAPKPSCRARTYCGRSFRGVRCHQARRTAMGHLKGKESFCIHQMRTKRVLTLNVPEELNLYGLYVYYWCKFVTLAR